MAYDRGRLKALESRVGSRRDTLTQDEIDELVKLRRLRIKNAENSKKESEESRKKTYEEHRRLSSPEGFYEYIKKEGKLPSNIKVNDRIIEYAIRNPDKVDIRQFPPNVQQQLKQAAIKNPSALVKATGWGAEALPAASAAIVGAFFGPGAAALALKGGDALKNFIQKIIGFKPGQELGTSRPGTQFDPASGIYSMLSKFDPEQLQQIKQKEAQNAAIREAGLPAQMQLAQNPDYLGRATSSPLGALMMLQGLVPQGGSGFPDTQRSSVPYLSLLAAPFLQDLYQSQQGQQATQYLGSKTKQLGSYIGGKAQELGGAIGAGFNRLLGRR